MGKKVTNIIDGKQIAAKVTEKVAVEVAQWVEAGNRSPVLAVILVGEDPASAIYVKNKALACEKVGIVSVKHQLPSDCTVEELETLIDQLNQSNDVDGILLQLPLPRHFNADAILEKIHPLKDVDGFHPYNIGRLLQRRPGIRPCTSWGVMALLDSINTQYKELDAVVVGSSNIVGRPMALELLLSGATVTVCHRFTKNLAQHIGRADLVISAAGKPELIKGAWIKPGAVVIDIGISRLDDGRICGDVEFESAKQRASWITPVPGGVGPMTVAMLLQNTLLAAKSASKL